MRERAFWRLSRSCLFAWAAALLGMSGCASSGWMARLTDGELPVEQPATPYPTAVGRSIPEPASEDQPAKPDIQELEPRPSAKKVLDPISVKMPPIAPLATVPSP